MRAQFVLSEIGIGLRRNLTMTISVIVTVTVSLALFGTGLLVSKQVDAMKGFWYDRVEVSVYLCGDVSDTVTCGGSGITDLQREELRKDLEATPQVERVFYESQEDAYEQFKEQFKDSPDLVENVTAEALPESFRVKLKDPRQFDVVASAFADRPGVEEVQDQKALLEKFFNGLETLRNIAIGTAVLQLLAAVLLISNTIRVAAFNRRRETGIMRLVGASNLFIRLPFLLEGTLAGLIGATFATIGLLTFQQVVIEGRLLQLFGTEFAGLRDEFPVIPFINEWAVLASAPWLYLVGVGLAALASFVTLQRHLRV